jgi:hypothetical protein
MRKMISGVRAAVLLASVIALGSILVPAASVSASTAYTQCFVKVIGTDANGNFITTPMQCYATYADLLRSQGAVNVSDGVTPATVTKAVLDTDSILATHYDGQYWSGSSFSVEGTTCGGGGLNLPASWNDRISSTANGCNDVVHYANANYGGTSYNCTGDGCLTMPANIDNQTSSIKYFA